MISNAHTVVAVLIIATVCLAESEYKTYAPGVGLIQDGNLLLTQYGRLESARAPESVLRPLPSTRAFISM
jgi:hypothetical protein